MDLEKDQGEPEQVVVRVTPLLSAHVRIQWFTPRRSRRRVHSTKDMASHVEPSQHSIPQERYEVCALGVLTCDKHLIEGSI